MGGFRGGQGGGVVRGRLFSPLDSAYARCCRLYFRKTTVAAAAVRLQRFSFLNYFKN